MSAPERIWVWWNEPHTARDPNERCRFEWPAVDEGPLT